MKKGIAIILLFINCVQYAFLQTGVIENTSANFIYYGLISPMRYSIVDYPCDSIIVFSNNAKIKGGPCEFSASPLDTNTMTIFWGTIINDDTSIIDSKTFYVKPIPHPKISLAGNIYGNIDKKNLRAQKGIGLYSEIKLQITYTIKKYSILVVKKNNTSRCYTFYSNLFDEKSYSVFSKLEKGDKLIFFNIEAVTQYGTKVYVEPSEFMISN